MQKGKTMDMKVEGKAMIFAKEYKTKSGDPFIKYATSMGKKKPDGEWDNGWLFVRFRKGVSVSNKTQINITSGWLTFDKYKSGEKDVTEWGVFVNEFDILEADVSGFTALQDEDIPF